MTTTTSCFNRRRTFFLHALRELFPLSILTAIMSILIVPVPFLYNLDYYRMRIQNAPAEQARSFLKTLLSRGVMEIGQALILTFFVSLLALTAALFCSRHLHQRTSTDFYLSLPLSRSEMLTLHLGAATVATAVPCLVVQLFSMALQQFVFRGYGAFHGAYFRETVLDWLTLLLAFLTVYLFVTAFAAAQGTTFDSLVISMALGFAPVFIVASSLQLYRQNLYGISPSFRFITLVSPLTWSVHALFKRGGFRSLEDNKLIVFFILWLGLIALLFCLCRFLMQRRRGELAGLPRQGIATNLVKAAAAFLGGFSLHSVFSNDTLLGHVGCFFLGMVIAGTIAEIVMSRGAHAFLRNIKWPLLGGVCLMLVFLSSYFDVFLLEQRIPVPDNVKSVSISYQGRLEDLQSRYYSRYTDEATLTNPESINTVLALHRKVVANAPRHQDDWSDIQQYPLRLYYQLQTGKTFYRHYDQLHQFDFASLAVLEGQEDFIRSSHILFQMEELDEEQARAIQGINLSDTLFGQRTSLRLDDAQTLQLLDALRADLLGETLEEILQPSQPAYGYLELSFRGVQSVSELWEDSESGLSFVVLEDSSCLALLTAEYQNTISLLEQWGYTSTPGQELEEITSATVFFVDSWGYRDRSDRVVVITPEDTGYANALKTHWNDTVTITNPDDLEAIFDASHNQLFLSDELLLSGDILYVLFEDRIGGVGVKLLCSQDLPEHYRSAIGLS